MFTHCLSVASQAPLRTRKGCMQLITSHDKKYHDGKTNEYLAHHQHLLVVLVPTIWGPATLSIRVFLMFSCRQSAQFSLSTSCSLMLVDWNLLWLNWPSVTSPIQAIAGPSHLAACSSVMLALFRIFFFAFHLISLLTSITRVLQFWTLQTQGLCKDSPLSGLPPFALIWSTEQKLDSVGPADNRPSTN